VVPEPFVTTHCSLHAVTLLRVLAGYVLCSISNFTNRLAEGSPDGGPSINYVSLNRPF
jgi:hypothetical protein